MNIKLIIFDLDGTLLWDDKSISERTIRALNCAADHGIYLVPATGRRYTVLPDNILALSCIRYMVLLNGAQIYDSKENIMIHHEDIPADEVRELLNYVEKKSYLYGCQQDEDGWVDSGNFDRLIEYSRLIPQFQRLPDYYVPMNDLKNAVSSVQKVQLYFLAQEEREQAFRDMLPRFPDLSITYSLSINIEINACAATKGNALKKLCDHLQISPSECMAFGDGINDLSMIDCAGTGVAMGNSEPEIISAADYVTVTNEQDGVAEMIEKYLKNEI